MNIKFEKKTFALTEIFIKYSFDSKAKVWDRKFQWNLPSAINSGCIIFWDKRRSNVVLNWPRCPLPGTEPEPPTKPSLGRGRSHLSTEPSIPSTGFYFHCALCGLLIAFVNGFDKKLCIWETFFSVTGKLYNGSFCIYIFYKKYSKTFYFVCYIFKKPRYEYFVLYCKFNRGNKFG